MKVFVDSIGVLGPGLTGWQAARTTLADTAPHVREGFVLPRLDVLPAAERRRVGLPVKLAISVGQDALAGSTQSAEDLPTVFTSSGGDGEVVHAICETLAGPDRLISPTRFHNSVHNAPSGYWGIATQSRAPSTSLCAFDWSFAAGLLESTSQAVVEQDFVLLIAYDWPHPEPINGVRTISDPFAVALVLSRHRCAESMASLDIAVGSGREQVSQMQDRELERLRLGNPAARALPLIAALARQRHADLAIEYVAGTTLKLTVEPI